MLEEANNKLGGQAELLLGSASEMHYPDEFFDLVTGMLTLHEMPRKIRSQVMNEMVRVLKKEGRILLIDYHPGSIRFPKGWMYKAVIYFFEIAAGREHFKNFRDFLANNGIPGLIDSYKLTMEKTKIVGGGNLGVYLLCAE
jgi:demethylmenaquinone methyltransferase/2-methoxy-6-polyprenyl-1,4-benzoquinol methylase